MTPLTPAETAVFALLVVGSVLLLLLLIAAPLEWAARRFPRFDAWVDRAMDRIFR